MLRRLLAAILIIGAFLAVIVVSWPQLFRVQHTGGVVHLVALRGSLIVGALIAVAVLALAALLLPTARRLAGSLVVVMLIAIGLNGAVMASRGISEAALPTPEEGDLVLMTWNTLGDVPGAAAIAELAIDHDADIVSLPETSEETARDVAERMRQAGSPMQVIVVAYSDYLKAQSTALLVSPELGGYTAGEDSGPSGDLPTVVADSGSGPRIVAVHALSPSTVEVAAWHEYLDWLSGLCEADDTIMLGDFNATVDHFSGLAGGAEGDGAVMGRCRDAATQAGSGAVGTWPASAPPLLGSPIDHILVGDAWEVVGVEIVTGTDSSGSDHRPVLAVIRPAGAMMER